MEKSGHKKLNTTSVIFKFFLFVIAAGLIFYAFPREGQFRYQFQEGKPWRYGLLTAPYNFSIYKTDESYKAEVDTALKLKYRPYLLMDQTVGDSIINLLKKDYSQHLHSVLPYYYLNYLSSQLQQIYAKGIMSASDLADLEKEQHTTATIVLNKMAESSPVASIYTSKKAYSSILQNLPGNIDKDLLIKSCKIESYLKENLQYDALMSQQAKASVINDISRTSGLIQRGERIIDKGEIVSHDTFLTLSSLKKITEERMSKSNETLIIIGQIVWILGMLLCLFLYLKNFCPQIFKHYYNLLFILILVVSLCLVTVVIVRNNVLLNVYLIPFAILPVMISTFFDVRSAFFTHVITVLICSAIVPFPFEFLLLELTVGMVVIFSLKDLTQRSQLVICVLWVFLTYAATYTVLALLQENELNHIQWQMYASFGINAVLMFSSYLLIYLFEWIFGYTSDVTLMELSNINSPLLREFSDNCPGTFQHSLQVSNLSAAAAQEIGAKVQLVRTGALYHDLGKLAHPSNFTENQTGGVNPLEKLALEDAAKAITDHVREGLKLANQHHLPKVIKDFIQTHHGEGYARYFYTLFKNEHPEKEPDREKFFYPGPNPFSRETAILMMADTIEAASRSLKEYSEESLSTLVDGLIDKQIQEGRYKDVPLTFQEVESIKSVFKQKLQSIYHVRIAYPEEKKQPTT